MRILAGGRLMTPSMRVQTQERAVLWLTVCPCMYRNPLRRSHSFLLRDSVKGTFMSRGSQPNLVSYADDEADHASSSRDENRKKGGHMRNVRPTSLITTLLPALKCCPGDTLTSSTLIAMGLAACLMLFKG